MRHCTSVGHNHRPLPISPRKNGLAKDIVVLSAEMNRTVFNLTLDLVAKSATKLLVVTARTFIRD
jgi:hypothetical protein